MRTCSEIRLAGTWDPASAVDAVVLDFDARHRRRFAMAGETGLAFLLDLPRTTTLRDGDGLVLGDGAVVRVKAAPERLIEVTASDLPALARIAWHLGNRHLPTQLLKDRLRLRDDHVIREMIEGLGGVIVAIEAPFDPEGGAFGHRAADGHARVPHHDHQSHASIDIRTARAPGLALTPSDLIRLQTWFASSFPVGAFSYSHGLEWAIEVGDVSSAASLREWIESVIRYGASRSDAIVLCAMWRAVSSESWNTVREIGALAGALQPSAERRLESLGQGAAFLTALMAAWPHPTLERFRTMCPDEVAFPVVAGAAGAAHGLRLDIVLTAYLHAFVANLVSAGVRLVPLGQTDGLKITAALESVIVEAAHEASAADFEDLGSAGILLDIASMRHETQYSRLFRS